MIGDRFGTQPHIAIQSSWSSMEIVHCNRLLSNVWIGCKDRELEPWLNYIDKDNGHCSSKTLVRVWRRRLANSRCNRNKNLLMTHDHLSRSKPVISTDRKTVEFSPSLLSGCAHLLGDEPALELAEWGNGVSKIYHTMNGESQPGITLFETRGFRWQRTPRRSLHQNRKHSTHLERRTNDLSEINFNAFVFLPLPSTGGTRTRQ